MTGNVGGFTQTGSRRHPGEPKKSQELAVTRRDTPISVLALDGHHRVEALVHRDQPYHKGKSLKVFYYLILKGSLSLFSVRHPDTQSYAPPLCKACSSFLFHSRESTLKNQSKISQCRHRILQVRGMISPIILFNGVKLNGPFLPVSRYSIENLQNSAVSPRKRVHARTPPNISEYSDI